MNHCIKHSGKKCAYPSSNLETIITGPKDSSFAMNISSFTSVNTVGSKKYPIKIVYYDFINTPSSLVAFYQTFLCTLLFCTYSTYLLTYLLTYICTYSIHLLEGPSILFYPMLCYANMPCYYYAILQYMLCYATCICCAMLCYAICYAMLCCAMLCYMLYAMLCCAVLCCAMLYAMPCHAMPCYAMLYVLSYCTLFSVHNAHLDG